MAKSKMYSGLYYSSITVEKFNALLTRQSRIRYLRNKLKGTGYNKSGVLGNIYQELRELS